MTKSASENGPEPYPNEDADLSWIFADLGCYDGLAIELSLNALDFGHGDREALDDLKLTILNLLCSNSTVTT